MFRRVKLTNFKGFERFELHLGDTAVLVGPNNAGKSTLISALRAASAMVRQARRQRPPSYSRDASIPRNSFPIGRARGDLVEENLRHEFRLERETRLEVTFSSSARLVAVWPAMEDDADEAQAPFFYLVDRNGEAFKSLQAVRDATPSIGAIPTLSPLEQREPLLSEDYVRAHVASRLSSRHFRNQLWLLGRPSAEEDGTSLRDFFEFSEAWLPELPLERPTLSGDADDRHVNVFYREGRTPKELVWAGDGVQVFVQLLLHLYRFRETEVVILDEPEIYLHADLQRRLVRCLSGRRGQVILASHSAEVVTEAPVDAAVLVDRTRRRAVRSTDPVMLAQLADTIGSSFNLRLAKVLRARVAVFVEGGDLGILRRLAAAVELEELVTETNVAVIKLEGASNRWRLDSFGWLQHEVLGGSVKGYVILDRDYHSAATLDARRASLKQAGLEVHIWKRHEIENYLLVPSLLARAAKVSEDEIVALLHQVTDEMREGVLLDLSATRIEDKDANPTGAGRSAKAEVDEAWPDIDARLGLFPGKETLTALNRALQGAGHRAVSIAALARLITADEVADEVVDVLRQISDLNR